MILDIKHFRDDYYYVLKDGKPVSVDASACSEWMETANRTLRRREFIINGEKVSVSTVFLGLNHSYHRNTAPILWETMIFGGNHDQEQWRYSSEAEAIKGHEYAENLVIGKV